MNNATQETQNYRNKRTVTRHLYLTSVANCLPSHNYTEVTSYTSLQVLKYEAIFPLFLSNICRKNSILQSVMHPNMNSHNLT
jgi:hypothetical protein